MLFQTRLYLGGCAAWDGMSEWREVAAVADVGTTAVEGWAGYWYQASPPPMLGYVPDALFPATTEKEQS